MKMDLLFVRTFDNNVRFTLVLRSKPYCYVFTLFNFGFFISYVS